MRAAGYIFLLVITTMGYCAKAQKVIKGNVYYTMWTNRPGKHYNYQEYEDTIFPVKYKIYLYERRGGELGYMKQKVKNTNFSIAISESELRTYKYIEFYVEDANGMYAKNLLLDSLCNTVDSLHIPLDDYNDKIIIGKPVIYLYPEKEQDISIVNDFKGDIINTYPPYKDKWHVIARPDGTLLNKEDGRKYNYLFWDGDIRLGPDQYSPQNGFYVSRDSTVVFLQDKLAYIGLNQVEINDFITYWMPLLNKNEMNFIHFYINDNLANTSVLTVTPAPASSIVLLMGYSGTSKSIKNRLPEQILPQVTRTGFTLVEWGGCEIPYKALP